MDEGHPLVGCHRGAALGRKRQSRTVQIGERRELEDPTIGLVDVAGLLCHRAKRAAAGCLSRAGTYARSLADQLRAVRSAPTRPAGRRRFAGIHSLCARCPAQTLPSAASTGPASRPLVSEHPVVTICAASADTPTRSNDKHGECRPLREQPHRKWSSICMGVWWPLLSLRLLCLGP